MFKLKTSKPKNPRLFLALVTVAMFSAACLPVLAISKGYVSDDMALRPGLVVSLSEGSDPSNPKVERASREFPERIIGVATTIDSSLVTIASGSQTVYVETSGEIDAFVTNLNGDVQNGDLLSLSPFKGILTRTTAGSPIVAIALDDFSRESADTYSIQEGGNDRDVLIDRVKVNLDQRSIANQAAAQSDSSLAKLGRSIAGKEVGELRVLIALVIFFIVLIAEGGIIYGAVSSAITSLGRNPLAREIIKRELVRVLFVAIIVLTLGIAAIYAVLWI